MFKRQHPADELHAVSRAIDSLHSRRRELESYLHAHPNDCIGAEYIAVSLFGQVYLSKKPADTPAAALPAAEPPAAKSPLAWLVPGGRHIVSET